MREPSFDGELALFVTYSADGWLNRRAALVDSLRREGIAVALIVNTDMAWTFRNADLLSRVDGLYVRQNKGIDFAAWAHVLQLRPEILDAKVLYFINDSLIGPIDLTKFSDVIRKIRTSKADVIGLSENLARGWHLQCFFLAFKQRALRSSAFIDFVQGIVCYEDKRDVISEYELRFASVLKRAGLDCKPLFCAIDARNPTAYHWKELIHPGFPFVKAELFRNIIPQVNADDCLKFLSLNGFDIRLVESSLADLEPANSEPPHPG